MDFITIDFETATSQRESPCEIGLTFVENNKIKETKSWLIKPHSYPHFDSFNISIHGITPDEVKNAPEFDELWNEIMPMIKGKFLIAHNAGFDMSVLRKTLELYNIPFPEFQYSCSYIFSKRIWTKLPSYDLKTLCRINDISFNHHRAGADSEATAKLVLKAFEKADIQQVDDISTKLRTTIGQLYIGGYKSSLTKKEYKGQKTEDIIGNPEKHNTESIFYGNSVVFTGTLSSMSRKEAQQLIADIGGIIGKGVTKTTDFLVVGQQDYRVVGDDGMSSKQEKAVKLIDNGSEIEIISEDDYLRNI